MTLVLRFAAGSHTGMIREHNEDSGYAGPRLLAVADGMGGQAAGEVASAEVLATLVPLDDDIPGADLLSLLGDSVQQANDRLRTMVEEDPQLEGMGCTLTAMLWTGQRMGMVHIGDSRAYLLRDGSLSQITQDHTWVQRLIDEGRITEEEAGTHPQRSLLMRALDGRGQAEPDLSIREVRAGDRYLICSDGLSGVVSHQTLEETLGSFYSPQQTVQELIQLALRGGGPDNITCIVADVLDVGDTDTMAGQVSDTPVVVGAVADGPPTMTAHLNTPASRAAGLGRPAPQPGGGDGQDFGEFGPAEGYEDYDGGYDLEKPDRRRRGRGARWFRRSLVLAVALGLVGGGAYYGWRWTQKQYYVGAEGDHVAVFRGLNQNLAGIGLSSVYKDYPSIELKYLSQLQQDQVQNTIAVDDVSAAMSRVQKLGDQASVCRKVAQGAVPPAAATPTPTPAPSHRTANRPSPGPSGTVAARAAYVEKAAASATPKPGTASGAPSAGRSPQPVPGQSAGGGAGNGRPVLTASEQELAKSCTQ
ncbi:protein phosphatase 2C domain-containing protein [Streptacidiphilus sp. ASG 303]|uniref:PP2C family protein-serine/threonine phosphatase n=1 Tax=Streptacidiphilus sp. ASG 303 TaxID=2896847 RepID=UPI001E36BE42|nr:PP2C family serine/threonine-protein phosphatase [Streptacidiphilus sp. ASG 303]MCD0482234.1 protein phosphatase 2C domain-containing protein [Streptacidiphilus sp. ASG 303]